MSPDFQIEFVTLDGYEFLVAEISYQNQLLCQMMRRRVDDEIEIEFTEMWRILESRVRLKFPLRSFLDVVEEARRDLLALKL